MFNHVCVKNGNVNILVDNVGLMVSIFTILISLATFYKNNKDYGGDGERGTVSAMIVHNNQINLQRIVKEWTHTKIKSAFFRRFGLSTFLK